MYNEFLNKSDLSILDYMEELGKKALHIYFFLKNPQLFTNLGTFLYLCSARNIICLLNSNR